MLAEEEESKLVYAGLWDKTIQKIDLKEKAIVSSWQALSDAVKAICITEDYIFVAGSDPVIRAWDHEGKKSKDYVGHQGWVYALKVHDNMLFSGGDDRSVKVWDIESCVMLDELLGHENGVTTLEFANGELFSGSYDHSIICWDIEEIKQQIEEREMMKAAEKESRVYEDKMKGVKKGKKGAKGSKGGAKAKAGKEKEKEKGKGKAKGKGKKGKK